MCMHTHKHSMSLCDNYAVLIVTMGIQQFPTASLYGAFGCNSLAAQWLCKSRGFFAMSGILSHFSGGGLWVWTCKIRGSQYHLCSYPCLRVDSPGAVRPMGKVCV